ncbi:MAG TPA: hypothetical protein VHL11_17925 [Phototrophicaceae bacterium]|nr:hypothetical protein [Phototrophicaceae bacterium]
MNYPVNEVKAVQRGVRLEREYVQDTSRQVISSGQVGDIVVVHLTLYVSQDVYYFTLQDTLPAGLKPLDPALLTTTETAESPTMKSVNKNNPY